MKERIQLPERIERKATVVYTDPDGNDHTFIAVSHTQAVSQLLAYIESVDAALKMKAKGSVYEFLMIVATDPQKFPLRFGLTNADDEFVETKEWIS